MKRICAAILAHVDAGKTTLSEQLLLHAGRIREAGSVDAGTAHTDDLPVERRRGISVRTTCVSFTWQDTEIQLMDTPGHTDFSAQIERAFWALDGAVLVVDAARGVQPQTELLCRELRKQNMPFIIFLNKMDRSGADRDGTLKRIQRRLTEAALPMWDREALTETLCSLREDWMVRYLEGDVPTPEEVETEIAEGTCAGRLHPVLWGSALRDEGVERLMDAMTAWLPDTRDHGQGLSGVVFAATQDRTMGRGLWVRLFGGRLENRMALELPVPGSGWTGSGEKVERKITQIRDGDGRDLGFLEAGQTGVVYGLGDLEIGHVFGRVPRVVSPGQLRTPLITVQVLPDREEERKKLWEACRELSWEDPLLHARYVKMTGEICLQVMGRVQLEILQEILETRFGLKARFGEARVIYRETIREAARGFVAYTMPKPCWAVMEFYLEPGEAGSGVTFVSTVADRDIMPRYQHQVEQALPLALRQGRLGWQVTDIRITLCGGNHHLIHTHPLDFIVATPMGIHDGLRRGGSVLLEPILEMVMIFPEELAGRVTSEILQMRGQVTDTENGDESVILRALVPVAASVDWTDTFASLTGGRGSMTSSLHSYRPCPEGVKQVCERRSVDPLDTARYILAARSALEGNLFDGEIQG